MWGAIVDERKDAEIGAEKTPQHMANEDEAVSAQPHSSANDEVRPGGDRLEEPNPGEMNSEEGEKAESEMPPMNNKAHLVAVLSKHRMVVIPVAVVAAVLIVLVVLFSTHIICFHNNVAAATCTAPETCLDCGAEFGEALGHAWADATCTEPRTCTVCGETDGVALGHTPGEWTTVKAATCTETGSEEAVCTVCGEKVTREIPMVEHTPGEMTVTEQPTVSSFLGQVHATPGKREQRCSVCGQVIATEEFELSEGEIADYFKGSCTTFTYDDAARNPDSLVGQNATFTGEVIQVMQSGDSYVLRVNKDSDYDCTMYVTYTAPAGAARILEDDVITLWGTLDGTETYETIFGASVTIPRFEALYIQ